MRGDYVPGDLGFDPLGLKPQDEAALRVMETKELNNGRLAVRGFDGVSAHASAPSTPRFLFFGSCCAGFAHVTWANAVLWGSTPWRCLLA